jgi:hypothetical protein
VPANSPLNASANHLLTRSTRPRRRDVFAAVENARLALAKRLSETPSSPPTDQLPLTSPSLAALKDSSALFKESSDSIAMAERVEMCQRTVVVDGKVYSVKRQSESVFLLRLSDLAVRYVVVTADSIDFHGFERFVWPEAADRISSFERLDDAAAYYEKLIGSSMD